MMRLFQLGLAIAILGAMAPLFGAGTASASCVMAPQSALYSDQVTRYAGPLMATGTPVTKTVFNPGDREVHVYQFDLDAVFHGPLDRTIRIAVNPHTSVSPTFSIGTRYLVSPRSTADLPDYDRLWKLHEYAEYTDSSCSLTQPLGADSDKTLVRVREVFGPGQSVPPATPPATVDHAAADSDDTLTGAAIPVILIATIGISIIVGSGIVLAANRNR